MADREQGRVLKSPETTHTERFYKLFPEQEAISDETQINHGTSLRVKTISPM